MVCDVLYSLPHLPCVVAGQVGLYTPLMIFLGFLNSLIALMSGEMYTAVMIKTVSSLSRKKSPPSYRHVLDVRETVLVSK